MAVGKEATLFSLTPGVLSLFGVVNALQTVRTSRLACPLLRRYLRHIGGILARPTSASHRTLAVFSFHIGL
jgi:hypothetical protein